MALDPTTPRSRRALLAAAAGGAAAVAASAAAPASVLALPTAVLTETANASGAQTLLNDTGDRTTAFATSNVGVAPALLVSNAAGVATTPTETDPDDPGGITSAAGTYSYSVNNTNAQPYWATQYTGVYGYSPTIPDTNNFATGVWGDSDDVGTYGSGSVGVMGDGAVGVIGRADLGGVGVRAFNFDATGVGLHVIGKVLFSRSGRKAIGAGKSSVKVTLAGVSSSSRVFAVLHSNRSGRYVRAVVPTAGSFTIYLNTTVTSTSYIAWFVIN